MLIKSGNTYFQNLGVSYDIDSDRVKSINEKISLIKDTI